MTVSTVTTESTVTSDPTTVALEVLSRLESAWNTADGAAFGAVYAPDASFVTVRGEHLVGAAAIGAGHAGIFSTIYAGSVNQMSLIRAYEVSADVVVSVSSATLDCPTGPLAGRHHALSTSVLARVGDSDGSWHVVSTHNTLVSG